MIEIVMSVCLIDAPDRCKDVRLSYMAESVTPFECMMYGQTEMAKWTEGNPNWKIAKWKCGAARQIAKI